jgi:branched-chain amino acid transport system substrate-binding protein
LINKILFNLIFLVVLAGCDQLGSGRSSAPINLAADDTAIVAPNQLTHVAVSDAPATLTPILANGRYRIKIGVAVPLSGGYAHLGQDIARSVQMAVQDANLLGLQWRQHPVEFSVVIIDDEAKQEKAIEVAQQLLKEDVFGVIGHLNSGTSIAASKFYAQATTPQISPSATTPDFTRNGFATTFRMVANDVKQGAVMAQYVLQRMNAHSMMLVDDRTAYGQGLTDQVDRDVRRGGMTNIVRDFITPETTDFSAVITTLKVKKPDVLLFGGMDRQVARLLQALYRAGIKIPVLTGDGACNTTLIELAGDAAEMMLCSQVGASLDKMPKGDAFEQRYRQVFQVVPQAYSAYAYDATFVLIDVFKRYLKTNKNNLIDINKSYIIDLLRLTRLDGVTGEVSFLPNGDSQHGVVTIYQVVHGELVAVEVFR